MPAMAVRLTQTLMPVRYSQHCPSFLTGRLASLSGTMCASGRMSPSSNRGLLLTGGQIGDAVILGAACKVLKGRSNGNGAKVGANFVVVEDIPAYARVVLPKPRVILND